MLLQFISHLLLCRPIPFHCHLVKVSILQAKYMQVCFTVVTLMINTIYTVHTRTHACTHIIIHRFIYYVVGIKKNSNISSKISVSVKVLSHPQLPLFSFSYNVLL